MNFEHFHASKTPLTPGINLIEASAGTGKTFTIAMLVARFVVENDIPIDKLLVVTFTKAATEELKDRIRKRLVDVKLAMDEKPKADSGIQTWLSQLNRPADVIRSRINLALMNIDQADIFTIHGFCQRILSEHALESGQLFDCQLTEDIAFIRQRCADDFWRRQIYCRDPWEAAVLMQKHSSPDDLLNSLPPLKADYALLPQQGDLEQLFQQLQQLADQLSPRLDAVFTSLKNALADNKFKKGILENLIAQEPVFHQWANKDSCDVPDFSALSLDGLFASLHGSKLRGDEKKQLYLESLNLDVGLFSQIQHTLQQIDISFRQQLYKDLQDSLQRQLEQENLLSFDDLISRLADALQGPQQQQLIQSIQKRYQAAFIDEFQDTDQHQWTIFSRLFQDAGQYLYLIGDPKQAIYKFRGADIYSYFAAQSQARHLFTLHHNWRSHPALVNAVNQIFGLQPQPFQFEQLAFHPVEPALSADSGEFRQHNTAPATMVLAQLAENNNARQTHWNKGNASQTLIIHVANEILRLLNGSASIYKGMKTDPVRPEDIAILVKTHSQAQQYRQILTQCGIPAILNSKESVFASQEAADLYYLLQALEQPGNIALLKQALACSWFGLDGQQIYRLSQDETELDQWLSRFHDYHQRWRQQGLLSMITTLFQQQNIPANIARQPQAERRLTNINHLLELLQQAATEQHSGPSKTLAWLHQAITQKPQHEATQLRLESDDNAVRIITLHSAKGLEYPIVFCPTLWDAGKPKNTGQVIQFHRNGRIWLDFGSENYRQHQAQAQQEQLAEDIRLFYVAVTRAKYRCYLYWADVRSRQDTANQSAMGWLLKLAGQNFEGQQKQLQYFSRRWPESFDYQLLEAECEIQGTYERQNNSPRLIARQHHRKLSTSWQMSSYTALSALSQSPPPEFPPDKADEPDTPLLDDQAMSLPKGAHSGNVLHEILEKIPFKTLAAGENIEDQRQQSCQRYGLILENPAIIDQMLQTAVTTPLSARDNAFTLARLEDRHCIKEMPFYLSLKTIQTGRINAILDACPAFKPLSDKSLSGFLTGFIDLVCYYSGRYYVMDYKSNALADYSPENLTAAMYEHNYGLQYWLYSLVLHYQLKQRLPDYDFERHFGGVKYLFLRGMQPGQPESGVYSDRPDIETLERLAALFYPSR